MTLVSTPLPEGGHEIRVTFGYHKTTPSGRKPSNCPPWQEHNETEAHLAAQKHVTFILEEWPDRSVRVVHDPEAQRFTVISIEPPRKTS